MSNITPVSHAEFIASVVARGDLPPERQPDPIIVASWGRCLNEFKLDPSNHHKPVVLEGQGLRERKARLGDMLEIARSECRNLHEQTANAGYAIVLTDASGVILDYICDQNLEPCFNRAGLLRGALWSEEHEGTNGMGTCLKEDRAVIVHRDDHFYSDYIDMTCTAVPIHDPHGRLLAVLDVTSSRSMDTKQSQVHTKVLVQTTVNFIEYRNFLRAYRHTQVLRFHSRPELLGIVTEAMLALDDDGRVIAANDSALLQLCFEKREQLVGRFIDEVFTLTRAALEEKNANRLHNIWPIHDVRHGRRYLAFLYRPTKPVARQNTVRSSRAAISVPAHSSDFCIDLKHLAGGDPHMAYNVRCARRVADKSIFVLLNGETGTGKEAFARAIHAASRRAERPFIALNCASIPESLIESELFGYKHGAFTGARREGMRGSILESDGGTLFLDEIGDMPAHLQTRLLRVLETKDVLPLGSQTPVKVDLHVISATNRDLRTLIEQGEFREDLYYRLNGLTLTLPRLQDRHDLKSLVRCALAAENDSGDTVSIEDVAFEKLLKYHWPGNLRELRNILRTALALSDDGIIRLADLPKQIADLDQEKRDRNAESSLVNEEFESPLGECTPLETAERDALLNELEHNHWNVTLTAEKLRMSRSTLYRKLKKYDISVS